MADKPKILVTGSNGQVGKELKDISDSFQQFDFVFLSRADMPIHHFELVRNFFITLKPAYCINCAAYTAVDRAEEEKEKAFQVNAEAVGVLAAICKEYGTKLIHISTDYVFNGHATVPYKEDSLTDPQCVYGLSKLEGEKQAQALNPEVIIIRSSWLYSVHGKNFVRTMIRLMQEKNEISVVDDQRGSPTYAADLAESILKIIVHSHINDQHSIVNWVPGIYHYCNEGVVSWFDFANEIKNIIKSTSIIKPISTVEFPTAAMRPAYSALDCSKIQKVFNLKLKNWKSSLKACIDKT